ncbi:MAG: hypothetical protein QOI95_1045 [Acidimicrobiaceae bacterium]|jgi:hypothetical protein
MDELRKAPHGGGSPELAALDRDASLRGYWPGSAWPVECGGNRRQKLARSPGLGLKPNDRLTSTSRTNGRWNVMFVQRDPGELYLYSTDMMGTANPVGRVERVHPESLETEAVSPDLATGGHIWCGAIVVHENGDIYCANGRYVHRLDADCSVVAERELPTDGPHNGLLVTSDGMIVTKDIRLGPPSSVILLLDPARLDIVARVEAPEPSMGRIAIDGEWLYVPGTEHLFRYRVTAGELALDDSWSPRYRRPGGGLAWDSCLYDGSAWLMDNGDTEAVHMIVEAQPSGSRVAEVERLTRYDVAQGVIRVSTEDGGATSFEPFGAARGWIIAPPLVHDGLVICWDTGNSLLGAFRADTFEEVWRNTMCVSMQPVLYPDTGELVVDDQTGGAHAVVVDVRTGEERGRALTDCPMLPNGMFFTPGFERDLYMCEPLAVARVAAR